MAPTVLQRLTWKTITAVSRWSGAPRTTLTLETPFSELRENAMDQLRGLNNEALEGESGFPVSAGAWSAAAPKLKKIRDLRGFNLEQVGP